MGIYYIFANHTKREWLCGWCLDKVQKFGAMASNTRVTGPLCAMLRDGWYGDRVAMVPDTTDEHYDIEREYTNISPQAAEEWNREISGKSGTEGQAARAELCGSCRRRKKGKDRR